MRLAFVAAVVSLALLPGMALAHAGVLRTTPADGSHLPASPPAFVIEFSEPVGVDPDGVRVVDAAGAPVTLGPAGASGSVVTQPLPPLPDGWYLASWSVVSEDGHVVHGAVAFAVGDVTGPAPNTVPFDPTPAALALARFVADLGLLVGAGSLAATVLLGAVSGRVRRLGMIAALAGAAGSGLVAALTILDGGAVALGGGLVQAAMVRAGLLVAAAIAVGLRSPRVAAVLAAAALTTMAVGGHPGEAPLTAALLVAHLAAASAWLGAAPAVVLVLFDRSVEDAAAERVVRRFSRLATLTVFVVLGAGSALAIVLTDPLAAGLDTRYVVLLLAKVGLVGIAALAGAFMRRRLSAGPVTRSRLRRVFASDTAIVVAVVALSSGLALGAPRAVVADDDIHVGHCPLDTSQGIAGLSLVPSRVGENTFYLDGAGTLANAAVELRLPGDQGAIEVALAPDGASWKGAGSVPVAGVWDVTVLLGRDAFTQERPECSLRVEP